MSRHERWEERIHVRKTFGVEVEKQHPDFVSRERHHRGQHGEEDEQVARDVL